MPVSPVPALGRTPDPTEIQVSERASTVQWVALAGLTSRDLFKVLYHAPDRLLQALPRNHPDLATSYEALGTVLAAENKVHDARLAFQRALEIRLLNFGPEHIYLAEIYESISRVELKDNPTAAKEDLNHALGIETKWWGDTDPRTQTTQRNLAKIGAN